MHPFLLLHWASRMQKLMNWESPVAMAAPEVPRFRPNMNRGSRAMFRIPPAVMPIMANAARPWRRRRLFMIKEHIINGVAIKI